ncbi:hypothetical protein H2198_008872 [Neophaeococcomyces mojaviensis]|uniref:Uncharacterized protein n=1 Tax=Neophaeococcomyces mojaviensis TaxID=3383035 RepID=A0ACC2ZWF2_9EURO|nr:hypothetical protein H2198_008872 [Knufia sp. JES_112]
MQEILEPDEHYNGVSLKFLFAKSTEIRRSYTRRGSMSDLCTKLTEPGFTPDVDEPSARQLNEKVNELGKANQPEALLPGGGLDTAKS